MWYFSVGDIERGVANEMHKTEDNQRGDPETGRLLL